MKFRAIVPCLSLFSRIGITCLLIVMACSAAIRAETPPATPTMGADYPTRQSLAEFYGAKSFSFEQLRQAVPENVDVLVWACHSRELPKAALDPKVIAHLREFVKRGGNLFLVGYSQAYVVDLGLEPARPNQSEQFDLVRESGYACSNRYSTGLKPVAEHEIFAGLTSSKEDPKAFLLGGSYTIILDICQWNDKPIKNGKTLATYCRIKDDKFQVFGKQQALNLWTLGRGKVLGYGCNVLLDDFWVSPHIKNLHRFLRNAASFLSGKAKPVIGALPETPGKLYADRLMSPPMHARQQPHSVDRRFPGLPYIAHWGWHAQISYQRGDREIVGLDYYKKRMIDEPFAWGANLLEFYAPDMSPDRNIGYPFEWKEDDPIKRPSGYWSGKWDGKWNIQKSRELFTEAHSHDMLVQIFYHPDPIRGRMSKEVALESQRQYCEFQSRELQNPLLYGWQASHDGFGTEWWGHSQTGEFVPFIWKYNPGTYRYSTAKLPKTGPHVSGTLMCAFARYAGINACGHSDRWRYMFHPPLYLSYQADCRSMKPSTRDAGRFFGDFGGGSTPDWIVRQAFDFARDRLYLDSSLWWLGEPLATMREEERPYVYGASADPLRCALTMTMRSVGSDGYRAKAITTVPMIPEQYVSSEPYPQDTTLIQNNYFRLLRMADGDRGVLQYDPLRLAYYHKTDRPRPCVELSPNFITAEVEPVATDSKKSSADSERVVFSVGDIDQSNKELKGKGGYDKRYVYRASSASEFPAEFRYEQSPDWPQEVEIPLDLPVGRYELDVYVYDVDHPATMEVTLDGHSVGYYFPIPAKGAEKKPTRMTLPLNLDQSNRHKLTIGVSKTLRPRDSKQSGLAHKVDAIRIRRIGTESVYSRPLASIGHRAQLEEVAVKDAAGECRQRRVYQVDSDWPLLRVDFTNESPEPRQWRTRLALPDYLDVDQVHQKVGADARPFWVAKSREKDHPELVLMVDGDAKMDWDKQAKQMVITTPKSKRSQCSLAVLVNDGLFPQVDTVPLKSILFAPTRKIALADTQADSPVEVKNPLPVARCEVFETDSTGPYFVAEQNRDGQRWWLVRGGQSSGDKHYLKLYEQPQGKSLVQRYGFIQDVVKPGYGCQYSLAIRDTITPNQCEVEVVKTGPFMFAPRIEWKKPFDTVRLDGKPWRYFDGQLIFLPNRPGRYTVEVESTGGSKAPKAPSLARTFLDVESARWIAEKNTLELVTWTPHWWSGPLAGDMPYVAELLSGDFVPVAVEGPAELIPWEEYQATAKDRREMAARGAMLKIRRPGKVRIRFEPRKDAQDK